MSGDEATKAEVLATKENPVAAPATNGPAAGEPSRGAQERRKGSLGFLCRIEIQNYRGFRGRFELLLPKGCNLLVYGENGAGKSSLYHSLRDFLESSHRGIKPDDHRHRFNTDPPLIRLSFWEQSPTNADEVVEKTYEWSTSKNDAVTAKIRAINRGKGFLDYKSLLRVYLLQGQAAEIDLFGLFIDTLLSNYVNPLTGLTFEAEWGRIRQPFSRYKGRPAALGKWVSDFNAGFERIVRESVGHASALLNTFDQDLALDVEFAAASYTWGPKHLERPKVVLKPSFRRMQQQDYFVVLNEARLSALAIAIYFAGLKLSPVTGPRILVLDDILIGLDMANRVKVLEIVQSHFDDWQILIFTYSKAWFERLKDHFENATDAHGWQAVVLWEEWWNGENSPRVVADGSGSLLATARTHLKHKDFAAAAVYARKAFERLCHRACARGSMYVLHVEFQNERKSEHYWTVIKSRLAEILDVEKRRTALLLVRRLEEARRFVLNRNAHFDNDDEDALSGEVGVAIQAVTDLGQFCDALAWSKKEFLSGRPESPLEEMHICLEASRAMVAKKAFKQGGAAMRHALVYFWRYFGAKHLVLAPIGEVLSPSDIWNAAIAQKKISEATSLRLEAARIYLYGGVKTSDFDTARFEEAASLLEELTKPPLAS